MPIFSAAAAAAYARDALTPKPDPRHALNLHPPVRAVSAAAAAAVYAGGAMNAKAQQT
jgi:hypothetical protein